jgi:hydroxyethylthiazole kinase-like uncharacterized protein yjeF
MEIKKFEASDFRQLWKPDEKSSGEDNGQVTIIGGSELFAGAPLLSLVAASRLVDMVFLATPNQDQETAQRVALFSQLRSVIWIPRQDLDKYIEKSDAVLIGPGMMRYSNEGEDEIDGVYDHAGTETKMLTHYLLNKFPHKRWVIDGGSLQVMDPQYIPAGAVLTPNKKEFEILFGRKMENIEVAAEMAKKYSCVIVHKGPVTIVTDGETLYEVHGGNAGLTKGGSGDTQAGITVGLLANNPPILAAAAAGWLIKKTAEQLFERVGYQYNSDDLAESVFGTYKKLIS